ncbi:MAG: hypothetical protein GXX96_22130 [Planctomycetaceae bacterium]|nr:hypothetical protein [Planctomycetaceae bacterium]
MRTWKSTHIVIGLILFILQSAAAAAQPAAIMTAETDYASIAIGADGQCQAFVDRAGGTNYCRTPSPGPFARIALEGKTHVATAARLNGDRLRLEFGESGVAVGLKVTARPKYFVVEVVDVSTDAIEELVFVDLPLKLTGAADEPFAACALALNLKTNVRAIPQATSQLWAACYPRFGFVGAKAALIGCPYNELRNAMQEVVSAADDLPHSPIGGPWALDGPNNYGSYLFDFGNLTEATVDSWIETAKRLGVTQIDFHGGRSFRFGDFLPAPDLYPKGAASMKAVIDKLHAAGMQAGLHTYAMFINKKCPYVTPVPDPRLGKDVTFTLAGDLPADATRVPVLESTDDMSTITGFFVRNSVTLQIDDELITYTGVAKESPYAFTECTRGACGTKIAPHKQGTPVHHLRECFGLFVPDGDSTLLTEVAAKTAELYNRAGFDMIYLDALDGGDAVAGRENAWHYQSKFTFEIFKRLERPAIMEMSTFHHHLWYVRSRMGAWDHPNRSHKKFIDIHCQANSALGRQFLPGNLGWWAFKTWQGPMGEPTHTDDIEYLAGKALGNNYGLSLMGISPSNVDSIPALPRLAAIVERYEMLRHANYFSEAVKERLRTPGEEFSLEQNAGGEWRFRPACYDKHKVEASDDRSRRWTVDNRFEEQPLQLRIEALSGIAPYDDPGAILLTDFNDPSLFSLRAAQPGVAAELERSAEQVKVGPASGLFRATNSTPSPTRSWCKIGKTFSPPIDLSGHEAIGLWVHGDGQGEVLNVQQTSPSHLSHAIADHYITIDFTGWRYVALLEPEGARHADYSWPYPGHYAVYRESIRPNQVETLSLWYNELPPSGTATCYLGPIRALPVVSATLRNPTVKLGGREIRFPVAIQTGQYLEFRGPHDCRLFGTKGEEISRIDPVGDVPVLKPGQNAVELTCDLLDSETPPRAYISVITRGPAFGDKNRPEDMREDFLRP